MIKLISEMLQENKKKGAVEKTQKVTKRSAKELEEKPISKFETTLVSACDKYNELYPKNQDEVDIAYQAAVIFYDKNHFVEAARRFGDIIGKYERDEVKPSIEVASKIADALEVGLDFLLGKTTAVLDKKTLDRLQEIQKLPEEERKVIYKVLDSLLRDAKAKQAYA